MPRELEVNPFDANDFEALKRAQRRLADFIPIMDKAERCGTNCDTYREIVRVLGERLANIEREFMNPPPQ